MGTSAEGPCSPASDAHLLTRAQQGHEPSSRALLERHGPRLYRIVERAHGDLQTTEDILQETFVRAIARGHQLREDGAVFPWLVRIALRVAFDQRRKRRREEPTKDIPEACDSGTPESESEKLQLRRKVRQALGRLPPYPRELLVLMYFAHLSTAELAETFNKSEVAIRKDLQRARERLRRRLGSVFEELS